MGELWIALGPLLLLSLIALLATYVPLAWIAGVAVALVGLGSLYGLPCGIYYHLVLRRELLRRGPLPEGWLWHPERQHALLDEVARRRVRMWFMVSGSGFVLTVTGAALGVLALALWFRAGGAAR